MVGKSKSKAQYMHTIIENALLPKYENKKLYFWLQSVKSTTKEKKHQHQHQHKDSSAHKHTDKNT